MGNVNLLTIFTTGLLTGGLTCMAVQGGLLTATIAQRESFDKLRTSSFDKLRTSSFDSALDKSDNRKNALPILVFLGVKLVAYTILGFLLGWVGSLFVLSLPIQIVFQAGVGLFMLGTALNLLEVHPLFRYFIIQPPRFLTRLVRKQSNSQSLFAPALLGGFTVFIPCGTTQAMMVLAVASGSPVLGAVILFLFVFGTSPVFFILGYFTTKLKDSLNRQFTGVVALGIILLAIYNLNGAVALTGSNYTLDTLWTNVWCSVSFCSDSVTLARSAVTDATITIGANGYSPRNLVIKAGSQVTLRLVNQGGGGCTQAFTIPRLSVQKIVSVGNSDTVTFTAPKEPQDLAFMCSMGMYRGIIKVI